MIVLHVISVTHHAKQTVRSRTAMVQWHSLGKYLSDFMGLISLTVLLSKFKIVIVFITKKSALINGPLVSI